MLCVCVLKAPHSSSNYYYICLLGEEEEGACQEEGELLTRAALAFMERNEDVAKLHAHLEVLSLLALLVQKYKY
jgi:hypothetical protein